MKPSAFDINFNDWKKAVTDLGLKPYTASQIIAWVYNKGITNPEDMSDLSKDARKILLDKFSWDLPEIDSKIEAEDGTIKLALKLKDGHLIECVLIPHEETERITVCLSSQVGCALGCKFCRTASMGFKRNLTVGEITSQLLVIGTITRAPITNVVFMGMGEPLNNSENIKNAIEYFVSLKAFGLGKRRITVSTAGVVPEILSFIEDTGVKLAISLNSPRSDVRGEIMPVEKKYPLPSLLETLKKFSKENKNKVTFEYVMFKDVNDTEDDLNKLVNVLKGIRSKINLIPFNSFPGCPYEPSSDETVLKWCKELNRKGIQTNIRHSRGQEIMAACGQLAAELP